MATSKSAIAIAIARKFPGPAGRRNLLRKLGLGLDDLVAPASGGSGAGAGGNAAMRDLRVAVENALSEIKNLPENAVAKILRVLDDHVRLDKLSDDDPDAERVREITAGDDDHADRLDNFRAWLRKAGMSPADIERATELASLVGDGEARDYLPANGLPKSGGFGGRLSGATAQHGMDAKMREAREVELDHLVGGGFSRITVGFDTRQPRRTASTPNARQIADFNAMFKDAARIAGG
jgi:hypothetical protein